jgi:hypothetical protein
MTALRPGLLAVVLLAMRHQSAPRDALTVAWIDIVAFLFFHGLPLQIGPSKPYWGDGTADALQWLGLALILAFSAAVVRLARRRAADATKALAA